jgi:hypothetical protein
MKMSLRIVLLFILAVCLATFPIVSSAQAPQAAPRITAAIDARNLTVLHGNVHPLARAESDQGAASEAQALHRMLLLLQRSPEQEATLQQLLSDQQDKVSGRYHEWLTPEQFGTQFGPSDADLQAVTQWLAAQGFGNMAVSAGRTTIEFSGTAGQVRNAFHTEIRRYAVKGEMHFANASDPAIPTALAPVVAGIVSLNNFPIRSNVKRLGTFQRSVRTGETRPLFTFPGCAGTCYGVGPADFAEIYNTQPLLSGSPKIDGTGQGIAIVGESNINVSDVTDFRTMFGLAQNFSTSNVIVNGEDPGITDTEGESDLDVQWAGAVAPGARIDFVTSASTETTPGVNLSALYIVDRNLDGVMSESFGGCEQTIGTTFNQFFSSLWEQAAAQGITVVVSAGDNGSAGCDDFTSGQTATKGLAVSGFASTPFNVAVGGTDFDQANRQSTFWNTTQTSTTTEPIPASAKSYIPETPWNDTCAPLGISGCNASNAQGIAAGSGGVSTLYAKPSWQVGTGVPADGHRDVPDVSLFAGNGLNGSFYIVCQKDVTTTSSCTLSSFSFSFQGVGGTSASAPSFAGIMALVNQKLANGSNPAPRQGNANYYLYALAQQQSTANLSCNSSSSPVAGCSFNDVTKGNNDVPCAGASTNCSNQVAGTIGVLIAPARPTTPAYTTTAGYDLATGLGSLNAQNVVNKWSSVNTTSTTTALTLNNGSAVNITHGQAVPYQISVTPTSANGDASLIATPTGNTVGIGPFTLSEGAASGTTTQLPGGTSYNVVAHYEGNGTDAPSDSSAVAVTVAPESSKVFITVPTFNPETGQETSATPTTLVYGSPYILRADVTNAAGSLSSLCKPPSCPTGTITFADTIGGVSQGPPNSGTFALNSSGFTEDVPVQFPGGTNIITATYSGDASFSAPSAATYTLKVTPLPTQMAPAFALTSPVLAGVPVNLESFLETQLYSGAAPGGTITFLDGATPMTGSLTLTPRAGIPGLDASVVGLLSTTFTSSGSHVVTAKYSGDPSYAASTSTGNPISVYWPTTMTVTPPNSTVNYGQSVTLTATLTTTGKSPTITGTFGVSTGQTLTPKLSVDGSGNQTLSATVTVTPQASGIIGIGYSGDSNYNGASGGDNVTVNVPDFSMASNPTSLTLSPGQPATAAVTVTPASAMNSTVALTCDASVLFGVACNLSQASVSLANSAAASSTISLTPFSTSTPANAVHATLKKQKAVLPIGFENQPWKFTGIAIVLLLLIAPLHRRRRYFAIASAAMSIIFILVIGCGGGSSSGGANSGGNGGGGSTGAGAGEAVVTTTTITLSSSKIGQAPNGNTSVNATAKVTSTNAITGTVTFWTLGGGGALSGPEPLINGTVTTSLHTAQAGFYPIYAQYNGDANNQGSSSAAMLLEVTGKGYAQITGTTGPLIHFLSVPVTIQ